MEAGKQEISEPKVLLRGETCGFNSDLDCSVIFYFLFKVQQGQGHVLHSKQN